MSPAILIASFNRPKLLASLLQSLANADGVAEVLIVVVDNSPTRSAKAVVEEFRGTSQIQTVYDWEQVPGISSARNRALDLAAQHDDLIFVDDETVDAKWLIELLTRLEGGRSTAVQGRVARNFAVSPRTWIVEGGFFSAPPFRDGEQMPHASTANLAIRRSRMPKGCSLRFAEEFSLTGGSDTFLTAQIVAAGGRIEFVENALVTEYVPVERTRPKWVLSRALRSGNTAGRVAIQMQMHRTAPRLKSFVTGIARLLFGLASTIVGLSVRNSGMQGRGLRIFCRGLGLAASAIGLKKVEYARRSK